MFDPNNSTARYMLPRDQKPAPASSVPLLKSSRFKTGDVVIFEVDHEMWDKCHAGMAAELNGGDGLHVRGQILGQRERPEIVVVVSESWMVH